MTYDDNGYRFFLVIWNWMKDLFYGFTGASEFITTPIFTIGDMSYSVLTLCTFAGITAFIGIAIIKWGLS